MKLIRGGLAALLAGATLIASAVPLETDLARISAKSEGGKQVFDGQLPIRRLAFNIGEGEWKDISMVADEVTIKFRVVAGQ
jgi:polyisoprenoid-binding protein YceI